MVEYKLVNGNITEDGHTMFMEDVLKRLERLDFLEKWKKNVGERINLKLTLEDFSEFLDENKTGNSELYRMNHCPVCDSDSHTEGECKERIKDMGENE